MIMLVVLYNTYDYCPVYSLDKLCVHNHTFLTEFD